MIQSQTAPATLLPEVVGAVTEAGALIRAEFHRPGGPRGDLDHAPVDSEVEELLKARLMRLHPCGWRGEETAGVDCRSLDAWVVDPQDGTRDFLVGRRGSAISVALLRRGAPVLGVVFAPVAPDDAGDLIAWAEGTALTRNGREIQPQAAGAAPVIALNASSADGAAVHREAFPGLRIRALPSPAYRLALAAVGEVDAALSHAFGLRSWDIAGGHALLIGAGRLLVDLAGRPIDHARDHFNGVIGGAPALVAQLAAQPIPSVPRRSRQPARPKAPEPNVLRLSRAQGSLLGQLAGDALGSAVEFQSAAAIARSHPGGVRDLADGGTWDLIAGQPTDDSEMALALARSLVAEGGFRPEAVGQAYVDWRRSGPFDIGSTTAVGIAALAEGRATRSDSQSNGALMRVAPIGILCAGDPVRAARLGAEDARLTHPHPVCQSASAAFAAAIAAGIAGAEPNEMAQAAFDHAGSGAAAEAVRARLTAAQTAPPAEFQRQMGWVLTALQNAFHQLLGGATLEAALIATVAAGGDTDTNGAVCGALLGAAQGRDAVPLRWRNAILTCRPVRAPGVRHPRPATYWPDDALALAEALLAAEK
ncbi:inositol monophosphatase family protein [Rhodobacter sp. CZR27]|uniref:inositol monophosphatase family protein n=1 Tax=Rhodobacter sp. CZR27 TaxID=2033869 RepID=UPI000BBE40F4|nr:inositol monophosphatase family protein [Rhodobacter sp. CZR27]